MAVNLAAKYAKKVDERFKLKSLTEVATHQDYEWEGVNSIKVYSIPTVAMNAYVRTGTSRYGTAAELDNTIQTYTVARDRGFTFTIDRGNQMETMGVMEAGKALARQNDEVIVPEIDTYRLAAWSAGAVANAGVPTATNITASNAFSSFLVGQEYLDENKVPQPGRYAFVTPAFYNFIKLDPTFLKASDSGQAKLNSGHVGDIDGVQIIKIPSFYFPVKTPFIITHNSVMCAPKRLEDYKTHDNPPGINGYLVEGRIIYDAFIMDAKKKGVYAWKTV